MISSGTCTIQDCVYYKTTEYSHSTNSYSDTKKRFTEFDSTFTSDNFELEFDFKTTDWGGGFGVNPSTSSSMYHHMITGTSYDGQYRFYVGGQNSGESVVNCGSASKNTYYHVKIKFHDSTVEVYLNDVLKQTFTDKTYFNGETRELMWGEWSGRNPTLYVKNIKLKTL